jgi:hypothetical protein
MASRRRGSSRFAATPEQALRILCVAGTLALRTLAASKPPDQWIPMRWESGEVAGLEAIKGSHVNCLLIPWIGGQPSNWDRVAAKAKEYGMTVFAVVQADKSANPDAKLAMQHKADGIVLEGDSPPAVVKSIHQIAGDSPVIELSSRATMHFDSSAPIVGTDEGVWPGIHLTEGKDAAEASATGSTWIYTNSGFLRGARAMTSKPVWIGVRPPDKSVVTEAGYVHAFSDAAAIGASWIIALDASTAKGLADHQPASLKKWEGLSRTIAFFQANRECVNYLPFSRLTLIQGPAEGSLLTGGAADMISASHTPVRIVPPNRLKPGLLKGSTVTLNLSKTALQPEQKAALAEYEESGGTVFAATDEWKKLSSMPANQTILDQKDAQSLQEAWQDLQALIHRKLLGIRLFNVPSVLFNLLQSPDGHRLAVALVSFDDYPAENITLHLAGKWKRATLLQPGKPPRDLEAYPVPEGTGIDLDQLAMTGILKVE